MGRPGKPAKTKIKAKRAPARTGAKPEDSRIRDLEKRLAEAQAVVVALRWDRPLAPVV